MIGVQALIMMHAGREEGRGRDQFSKTDVYNEIIGASSAPISFAPFPHATGANLRTIATLGQEQQYLSI